MNKKIVALFVIILFFGVNRSFAQSESTSGSTLTIELTSSPNFSDGALLTPGFIKFRYFIAENMAVRLSTWVNANSNQEVPQTVLKHNYMTFRPGFEYHLSSNENLSPYFGVDFVFDLAQFSKHTSVGMPVTGAYDIDNIVNFTNRGYYTLGGYTFAGIDFYRSKRFYFGTEIGFEYGFTTHAQVNYGTQLFRDKTKTSQFNTVVSNTFRVGFMLF